MGEKIFSESMTIVRRFQCEFIKHLELLVGSCIWQKVFKWRGHWVCSWCPWNNRGIDEVSACGRQINHNYRRHN